MAVMGTGAPNISGEHVPNSVLKFIDVYHTCKKMCFNVILFFYSYNVCFMNI